MSDPPPLILASRSPRRAQLLGQLGLAFDMLPADVDERTRPGEEPGEHAERLAREKASAIARLRPDALVIGSDTVVVVGGAVLGKPRDPAEAITILMRLQGRRHTVVTGVAVASGLDIYSAAERVQVVFRPFDERTAGEYVASGEPMDKAGAYGIQGLGAALVERIDGDYFAVMGLPIVRLLALLQRAGVRYNFRGLSVR